MYMREMREQEKPNKQIFSCIQNPNWFVECLMFVRNRSRESKSKSKPKTKTNHNDVERYI